MLFLKEYCGGGTVEVLKLVVMAETSCKRSEADMSSLEIAHEKGVLKLNLKFSTCSLISIEVQLKLTGASQVDEDNDSFSL